MSVGTHADVTVRARRLASAPQLWRLNELGLLEEAIALGGAPVSADAAKLTLAAAAARGEWRPPPARIPPSWPEREAVARYNRNRERRELPAWLEALKEAE